MTDRMSRLIYADDGRRWPVQPTTTTTSLRSHHSSLRPRMAARSLQSALLLATLLLIQCADDWFDDQQYFDTSLCETDQAMALGMESGAIPDSALSASSSYNVGNVGPHTARLNVDKDGGAWCPAQFINSTNSGTEWIQVKLHEPYVITKIATQGRFANTYGKEYTEFLWLEYTRDEKTWIQWRNKGNPDIEGNADTYSIMEKVLDIPLVGVIAIRLLPVSQHPRTCCLRFEIYGCPYRDGPISYSMFDGYHGGHLGNLLDETYDGNRTKSGWLYGGLGQLTDGIKGDSDYKVNHGYEWIGWRNVTSRDNPVEITFEFADVRNFTTAYFYSNNAFSKNNRVFDSAKMYYSLDGERWSPDPKPFYYMPDLVMEQARDAIIHLRNRIGRFIKFELYFESKWLLISEVRFISQPVQPGAIIKEMANTIKPPGHITTTAISSSRSLFREPIVFIICAIVGFLFLIFLALLLLLIHRRKEKITGAEYMTVPMKNVASGPVYCEPHTFTRLSPYEDDPDYAVPDLFSNNKVTFLNLNGNSKTFRPLPNTFQKNNNDSDDDGKAKYYASTDVLGRNQFEQSNHAYNVDKDPGHFFFKKSPAMVATPPPPLPPLPLIKTNSLSPPSSISSNSSRSKAAHNTSGQSDSLDSYENTPLHTSATKTPSPVIANSLKIPQLKDSDVSVINGQFGYSKYGDCELGCLNRNNEKRLVILRTLFRNAQFRDEFIDEMNVKWCLSSKCTESFSRFYGYISKYEYLAMVIEYGDMDLKKFLRTSSPTTIGVHRLIDIARQIADAMQDLNKHGFIHRDLAARNCLIYTSNHLVKITDSGAFIKDYKAEYYNEEFPIRWMSYESILKAKFTNKSDVHSYGVTLWEIFSYCQSLPLEHLTEMEIMNEIVNSNQANDEGNFYNHPFSDSRPGSLKVLQLSQPVDCPNEIFELILKCTNRNEFLRPEFYEISSFLSKKCLNYRLN